MISTAKASTIAENALISARRDGAHVVSCEFDDSWLAWAGRARSRKLPIRSRTGW